MSRVVHPLFTVMDPHFRAFSFVDRITAFEQGRSAVGQYVVPAALDCFSNSLVSEAVGQLAAWGAMAAFDFTRRPVAGIAGHVGMIGCVNPGQTLDLEVSIESVDEDAIAYGGTASVEGRPVVELQHCVGPMVAVDEFDEPAKLRERFELLRGAGAPPGQFGGIPEFDLNEQSGVNGDSMTAVLNVPESAELFADHFPRRPVFPGTLLTQTALHLAVDLMERMRPSTNGSRWIPKAVADLKLRSFTPPGAQIELGAQARRIEDMGSTVEIRMRNNGKRIGSCRVNLTTEPTA